MAQTLWKWQLAPPLGQNDPLLPNHQSSFCWIYLPLLTLNHQILLSTLSSLRFHFAGLNPLSLVGILWWSGEGRYPKHINWSLGFPRDRFLDPLFFSTYTTSLAPIIQKHGFYHCYANDTQLYLSIYLSIFSTRWSNGSCTDLRLPGRHLGMDERTSSTAQPGKDCASLSSLPLQLYSMTSIFS